MELPLAAGADILFKATAKLHTQKPGSVRVSTYSQAIQHCLDTACHLFLAMQHCRHRCQLACLP